MMHMVGNFWMLAAVRKCVMAPERSSYRLQSGRLPIDEDARWAARDASKNIADWLYFANVAKFGAIFRDDVQIVRYRDLAARRHYKRELRGAESLSVRIKG